MTSTYLGYKVYANNIQQTLLRTAAEPAVASDQKYFNANIGKVTSVDGFLNNYRLFNYAMKAYGLSDLGNAKALMKKVLESNLSDSASFANRLSDSRYTAFAKAFNFSAKGTIASAGAVQTSAQQADLLQRLDADDSLTTGLQTELSSLKSVSDFESNSGLYSQVMTAYGLDTKTVLKSDVTLALQSNLSDPNSFANRAGNEKLRTLAEDFNFASDGGVGSQRMLQSVQNISATQAAYIAASPTDTASQANASTESAYYAAKVPALTSVDQLLADKRLVSVVKTAFSLDANMTNDQLRGILTSNLLDPKSAANTYGASSATTTPTNYQILAGAFSIGTDGTAWDHSAAISATNQSAMTAAYASAIGTDKTATAAGQIETDYVTSQLATTKSVNGLLSDSRVVAYLKKAFDLPNATTTDLGNVLRSNLLDSSSAANTSGSKARALAAAFNFAPNGLVYDQRDSLSTKNTGAITAAYQGNAKTDSASKAAAQTETDYFTATIPRIKSVDDLLSDKRLVAYVAKAYNITSVQVSKLRQALTSSVLDSKSAANKLGGGYLAAAGAFDFASDGTISHPADKEVQTKAGIVATNSAYLEQVMETEAGDQNEGVRLALYFRAKAPTITSAYSILADKALTQVVQTMLGLSSTSSKADIDSQARTITQRLNLADLKDPAKLEKLVARFSALYDINNSSSDTSSNISLLF